MAITGSPAPKWRIWSNAVRGQPAERGRADDEPDARAVAAEGGRRGTLPGDAQQQLGEPVDADRRGGRVVDAGRERLDRDIGQLAHRQLDVLLQRPLGTQHATPPHRLGQIVVAGGGRPDRRQRFPVEDEIAHDRLDPDGQLALAADGEEPVGHDRLEIALAGGGHHCGGRHRHDPSIRQRLADPRREAPVDQRFAVPDHALDHGRNADRLGDVVDEVDQEADAEEREHDRADDCHARHEALEIVLLAPHGAEHQQRIDEGADKDAQDHLDAAIAHECAQHPRGELAGGELQGDDRDREDGAGDGDQRAGNRDQYAARPVRPAAEGPKAAPALVEGEPAIQLDHGEREERAAEREQAGQKPEALPCRVPPAPEARPHRPSFASA